MIKNCKKTVTENSQFDVTLGLIEFKIIIGFADYSQTILYYCMQTHINYNAEQSAVLYIHFFVIPYDILDSWFFHKMG